MTTRLQQILAAEGLEGGRLCDIVNIEHEGFCRLKGWSHLPHEFIECWEVQPRDCPDCGSHGGPSVWAKHDEVRTNPDFGCNQWERRRGRRPAEEEEDGDDDDA